MIYHQRDNRRKRVRFIKIFSLFIILIIFVSLLNAFAPHLFSPLVHAISRPLFSSQSLIGHSAVTLRDLVYSKQQLADENRRLREELKLINAIRTERDVYKKQVTELEETLGRVNDPTRMVFARILSKPGSSPYDTIIVDVGRDEGIQSQDLVLGPDDIVLGEVSEVYGKTSVIILYSSPEHKTPVLVGNNTIEASAVGKGGGTFEIRLPRNVEVVEGDAVAATRFPTKPFGTIYKVMLEPTDTFEKVLFRNPLNINEMSSVLIQTE